jgi:hypothetical protein
LRLSRSVSGNVLFSAKTYMCGFVRTILMLGMVTHVLSQGNHGFTDGTNNTVGTTIQSRM